MTAPYWLLQVAIIAIVVFWMVGAYNRLMGLRNGVASAWGQVEPALARRGEAMAAVIGLVREPMAEEAATLQALAEAQTRTQQAAEAVRASRSRADIVGQWAAAETALASPATRLRALLDLHAAQLRDSAAGAALPAARQAWDDADPRVAYARQTYNAAVQAYNDALRLWPTRVITAVFGFTPAGPA